MIKNVFEENLTSKLLQKETLNIIKNVRNKEICEIGCGNGNISNYLINNSKHENYFYLSDISSVAIQQAKKKISYDKVNFKTGSIFEPWSNKKFDFIISDVSSINQTVAEKSPWYEGIETNCGQDGLKNVKKIVKKIKNNIKEEGVFIIPLISLSNTDEMKRLLRLHFNNIKETKKIYWPIPRFFEKNIKTFNKLKNRKLIYFENKFGQYIAYTSVAICKKIK